METDTKRKWTESERKMLELMRSVGGSDLTGQVSLDDIVGSIGLDPAKKSDRSKACMRITSLCAKLAFYEGYMVRTSNFGRGFKGVYSFKLPLSAI
jgi:hypothetical protein